MLISHCRVLSFAMTATSLSQPASLKAKPARNTPIISARQKAVPAIVNPSAAMCWKVNLTNAYATSDPRKDYSIWPKPLTLQKMVLRLAFRERMAYDRNSGLRTLNLSIPFKMLVEFKMGDLKMVTPRGFEPLTYRLGIRLRAPYCAISCLFAALF